MFGTERLDAAADCQGRGAQGTLESVLRELDGFGHGRTLGDDRTLLVARVRE
jgi:hypothetical protein